MVIQRIQSVYLLLVAILMGVYSFMDVAMVETTENVKASLSLWNASTVSFILSVLVTILSLITIFKFKHLKLQITLCSINILLIVAQVAVLIGVLMSGVYVSSNMFLANCMPVIAVIFLFLSISAIVKDKKLLSSYDRLR